MKKTALLLALIMTLVLLFVGCKQETSEQPPEPPTPAALPTLEELAALNDFKEILKAHENIHIHSVCTATNPEESIVQDAVYFDGNGKIDYHMRDISSADGSVVALVSRFGGAFYSVEENMPWAYLEVGDEYILDMFLPAVFDALPLGKAYVDGDQIVHHAYMIYEEDGEFDALRYDTTYYFDKETYILEKVEYVTYDEKHVATETVVSEFTYDVILSDIFETTLYDTVHNSEKRIDLEIVLGEGEDAKTYSYVATTDMSLAGIIDGEIYSFYTDAECTNLVDTLAEYEGTKSMTLYAKALVFEDDVRYTVTEEEWNASVVQPNYTVELVGDGESRFVKHTVDAIEISSALIIFVDDKQYEIEFEDGAYIAYDVTFMEYWHGGMLETFVYDEFFYDEENCVYVYDGIEEVGTKWEVRFENGVLIYVDTITYEDGEPVRVDTQRYSDIGTTVIDIPEYTIHVEEEVRTTVTEEEWNLNAERSNYTAEFITFNQAFEMTTHSFATDGNAIIFDGNLIVSQGDKMYMLEEVDGVWVATEWNEYNISMTLIPEGLTFADFEYSEEAECYIQKSDNGTGRFYNVTFENGVALFVYQHASNDPSADAYFDLYGLSQIEFGGVEIEVPEYVIPV